MGFYEKKIAGKRFAVSLPLAVGELVLGILLLVNPKSLMSVLLVALGALLILLGGLSVFKYVRLSREESQLGWKLALGLGSAAAGLFILFQQSWMAQMFGTLLAVYGTVVTATAFMKLQMAVDALRIKRPMWYLMAISCLVSAIAAVLLYRNPFGGENAAWIVLGIMLIVIAGLDLGYFIMGRVKRKEEA